MAKTHSLLNWLFSVSIAIICHHAVPMATFYALFLMAGMSEILHILYKCYLIADKPGPPEDLKARNITDNSFDVTWDEPRDNGGAKISNYIVEKRDAGKRAWNHVRTSYQFIL